MAVPKVNEDFLKELEDMGFLRAPATRALHYSGNTSVEDAITWIFEHKDDPDIDQMPKVEVDIEIESPNEPFDMTEEIRRRAQELKERARERNQEEEKIMERDREKERIRSGKELIEAKRTLEENERKRNLASRQAEKEEEKRAREKIRWKLEQDKLERKGKLAMPSKNPSSVKFSIPVAQDKENLQPIKSVTKTELARGCLRSLKRNYKEDNARVKKAFQTLLVYVGNVVRNPNEEKFRKIRINNPKFQERVGNLKGGIEFLEVCGFERTNDGDFLYLPREKVDISLLKSAGSEINSAISNPFFGVLCRTEDVAK